MENQEEQDPYGTGGLQRPSMEWPPINLGEPHEEVAFNYTHPPSGRLAAEQLADDILRQILRDIERDRTQELIPDFQDLNSDPTELMGTDLTTIDLAMQDAFSFFYKDIS